MKTDRSTETQQSMQVQPLVHNLILQRKIEDAKLASGFCERLTRWIRDFEKSLDNEHEVGVRLVSFGTTVVFHLRSIGYANPSLITFIGEIEDGAPVELIQHVSQISILLMKLPRKNPECPKRPFGFTAASPSL